VSARAPRGASAAARCHGHPQRTPRPPTRTGQAAAHSANTPRNGRERGPVLCYSRGVNITELVIFHRSGGSSPPSDTFSNYSSYVGPSRFLAGYSGDVATCCGSRCPVRTMARWRYAGSVTMPAAWPGSGCSADGRAAHVRHDLGVAAERNVDGVSAVTEGQFPAGLPCLRLGQGPPLVMVLGRTRTRPV
jgi:hypothetical protein